MLPLDFLRPFIGVPTGFWVFFTTCRWCFLSILPSDGCTDWLIDKESFTLAKEMGLLDSLQKFISHKHDQIRGCAVDIKKLYEA